MKEWKGYSNEFTVDVDKVPFTKDYVESVGKVEKEFVWVDSKVWVKKNWKKIE